MNLFYSLLDLRRRGPFHGHNIRPNISMRHQISNTDDSHPCHDDLDLRIIVHQNLPTPSAGTYDPSAPAGDGDDVRQILRASGGGGAEGDELCAGPAGKVGDV